MTTVTRAFTMLHVTGIPASYDNYIWLLARPGERRVTIIDPSNAEPVLAHLHQHQLVLDSILVTHHHRDHIGGLTALKAATGARVYGPAIERVADCDVALTEGDAVDLSHLAQRLQVLAVPGHVREHIVATVVSSAAIPCFWLAVAASSPVPPSSCSPRCNAWPSYRRTRRFIAATNTPKPTCALPVPSRRAGRPDRTRAGLARARHPDRAGRVAGRTRQQPVPSLPRTRLASSGRA
jgi:hypothetical protein